MLPVWKEKIKAEVCAYYLLTFIPVFKKKLKRVYKGELSVRAERK
jgi:hypothetical protein